MLNFGTDPSEKFQLEFIKNDGPRKRRKDLYGLKNIMPSLAGVYVIYTDKEIARYRGSSPILKIGASGNLFQRFKQYNNKKWVTKKNSHGGRFTVAEVMKIQKKGRTDAFVMAHLWNLKTQKLFLDFYRYHESGPSPGQLEEKFLNMYMAEYWEIPPLNLSLKG